MAQKQKQKRPSPLDEPPTASSSDSSEEEEIPSSQPHPEEQEDDEEVSSEEQEEDDDDEEEEEEQQQHQPPSKNPPPPPAKPAPSDSHTASGSDSDSESDSPAATPVYKVKPIASKPIEQTTPKPNSKAQPSASKRPVENNNNNNGHANDAKRSKKQKVTDADPPSDDDEAEEDAKKSGADSRNPFQRLWSEEDEIAILKGMVDFTSKTGADPFKHANAFHDFMKKTLHADASSNQLKEKIRRLKKKFETNAGKGKNGQDPTFSKPHDQESFELSKKVWGNEEGGGEGGGKANGAVEKPKSNGKSAKSPKKKASKMIVAPSKPKPELKHELTSKDSKDAVKMDIDEKIDTTSQLLEVVRADKGVGLYGLSEDVVKRGMGLIGASEKAELESLWKELQAAELEVSVKRAELVAKQARLILEANKSSNY